MSPFEGRHCQCSRGRLLFKKPLRQWLGERAHRDRGDSWFHHGSSSSHFTPLTLIGLVVLITTTVPQKRLEGYITTMKGGVAFSFPGYARVRADPDAERSGTAYRMSVAGKTGGR